MRARAASRQVFPARGATIKDADPGSDKSRSFTEQSRHPRKHGPTSRGRAPLFLAVAPHADIKAGRPFEPGAAVSPMAAHVPPEVVFLGARRRRPEGNPRYRGRPPLLAGKPAASPADIKRGLPPRRAKRRWPPSKGRACAANKAAVPAGREAPAQSNPTHRGRSRAQTRAMPSARNPQPTEGDRSAPTAVPSRPQISSNAGREAASSRERTGATADQNPNTGQRRFRIIRVRPGGGRPLREGAVHIRTAPPAAPAGMVRPAVLRFGAPSPEAAGAPGRRPTADAPAHAAVNHTALAHQRIFRYRHIRE